MILREQYKRNTSLGVLTTNIEKGFIKVYSETFESDDNYNKSLK